MGMATVGNNSKIILAYDIESKRAFLDRGQQAEDFEDQNPGILYVDSWSDENKVKAGVACLCVIEASNQIPPSVFIDENLKDAQVLFDQAALLLTYNGMDYDNKVLAGHGLVIPAEKSLDLCKVITAALGGRRRVKLEDLAMANLGTGKSGKGALAPHWWQGGHQARTVGYCLKDTWLLLKLYELALAQRYLLHPYEADAHIRLQFNLLQQVGLFQ